MNERSAAIKSIEDQIEKALWDFEVHEKLDQALDVYKDAEAKLTSLQVEQSELEFAEVQRVLSYCLMRQGNILRQLGKPQEALALSDREIAAARASGDEITLGRSLMSNGTNLVVAGELEQGLAMLEQAREQFEKGDSFDHRQGLGWYWLLLADLANAGMITKSPQEVIEITTRALEILEPIENWPGVARGYAARVKAHETLGETEEAVKDLEAQKLFEDKITPTEGNSID